MRGSGGILYSGPEDKLNKQTSTERILKKLFLKTALNLFSVVWKSNFLVKIIEQMESGNYLLRTKSITTFDWSVDYVQKGLLNKVFSRLQLL